MRAIAASAVTLALSLLAACGQKETPTPRATPDARRATAIDAGPPVDPRVASGQRLYANFCALCHGPDAKGYAADNAPSLVNPTFLATASDEFLITGIVEGRPGTAMGAYGKARGGPLSDRDIGDLIAFLRKGGPAVETLSAAAIPGDAALGKQVYEASCQTCHGTETVRSTAPHLANPVFLASATDAFMKEAIVRGRPGTPMEAYAGKLDDAAIANVIAYVRTWAKPVVRPEPPAPPPVNDNPAMVLNPKGKAPTFTLRDGRFVGVDQVKRALDEGRRMIIVDARTPADWQRSRVTGAILAPYYELARLDGIPNDGTWVVAYCACPHHASGIVVDELKKRGYPNVAVLDEGVNVWRQKGYPVEGTDPHGDPHAGHDHSGHGH